MGFENINEKLDDNQDEITAAINQSVDTYAEIINHIQSNQADESEYQRQLNEKLDNVIEAFTPSKSKIPTEFNYVPFDYVPFDYVPTKDTSNEIEMLGQLEQVLRPTLDTGRSDKTETTYSAPNIKLKLYKNDDIKDTELTKIGKASITNKLINPSLTEDQNRYLMDAEKNLAKPGIYDDLQKKIYLGKALSSDDYNKKVVPLVRELRNGYIKENSEDKNAYVDAIKFSKSIIGMGIKDTSKIKPPETKVDDLKLLGRYYIDTNKLSNNQLRLFHQSGNHVKYFKQQVISDDLVNLINFILEKKKYNEKLFNLLEDEEKTLFKNIFMKSGLGKMLNVYIYDHTNKDAKKKYEDLKERVAILQGEIDAGNDNKQIVKDLNETIKELKQQIVYMSQLGLINLKTAQMMILSL